MTPVTAYGHELCARIESNPGLALGRGQVLPAVVLLLVIYDNPGSVELLCTALAQPGLEILTASNPEEGLNLFRNRRPQVVLTDLVMP